MIAILALAIIIVYTESLVSVVFSVMSQSEIPMYKFLIVIFGTFIVVREILKDKVEKIVNYDERERTREKYSKYVKALAVVAVVLLPFAFLVSEEGGGYDNLELKEIFAGENDTSKDYSTSSYNSTSSYSSTVSSTTSKRDKCGKDGCSQEKGGNGTIYCDLHARAYVREQGYSDCLDGECYRSKSGSSLYCYIHTCEWNDCTSKKQEGGDYCATHQRERDEARERRQQSTKKTSSKKKTTQSYDMPDCDDYESYEDFMDEWDGYMPDGSDAEDYWEDW